MTNHNYNDHLTVASCWTPWPHLCSHTGRALAVGPTVLASVTVSQPELNKCAACGLLRSLHFFTFIIIPHSLPLPGEAPFLGFPSFCCIDASLRPSGRPSRVVVSVPAYSVRSADDKRDGPGPVGGDAVVRDRAAAVLRLCVQGWAQPTVPVGMGSMLDHRVLSSERGSVLCEYVQSLISVSRMNAN